MSTNTSKFMATPQLTWCFDTREWERLLRLAWSKMKVEMRLPLNILGLLSKFFQYLVVQYILYLYRIAYFSLLRGDLSWSNGI